MRPWTIRGFVLAIVLVLVLAFLFGCTALTRPEAPLVCPTPTGTQQPAPGSTIVTTYAYFKSGVSGPAYAVILVYDRSLRPACLQFDA